MISLRCRFREFGSESDGLSDALAEAPRTILAVTETDLDFGRLEDLESPFFPDAASAACGRAKLLGEGERLSLIHI